MAEYRISDEGGDEIIEAESMDEAKKKARNWLRDTFDVEFDEGEGTFWCDAYVEEIGNEEDMYSEHVTVAINPPEPKCTADSHDWQSPYRIVGGIEENPGVWGHGGGVIIKECCMNCGCLRETDTWAQRPDTGEQGLESVRYVEGYYAEELEE